VFVCNAEKHFSSHDVRTSVCLEREGDRECACARACTYVCVCVWESVCGRECVCVGERVRNG